MSRLSIAAFVISLSVASAATIPGSTYTDDVLSDPVPVFADILIGSNGPSSLQDFNFGSGSVSIPIPSKTVPVNTLILMSFGLRGDVLTDATWDWTATGDYFTDAGADYQFTVNPDLPSGPSVSVPYDGSGSLVINWSPFVYINSDMIGGGGPFFIVDTVSGSLQLDVQISFDPVGATATPEPTTLFSAPFALAGLVIWRRRIRKQ